MINMHRKSSLSIPGALHLWQEELEAGKYLAGMMIAECFYRCFQWKGV
jgi:hypothetical protein